LLEALWPWLESVEVCCATIAAAVIVPPFDLPDMRLSGRCDACSTVGDTRRKDATCPSVTMDEALIIYVRASRVRR